nr:CRISPR-associated protein Cas4 [Candidatus Sigynarchaeota archaeon]
MLFTHDYAEPSQIKTFVHCARSWYIENQLKIRLYNDHVEIGKYEHEHYWRNAVKRKDVYIISDKWKMKGKCDYIIDEHGVQVPVEIKKSRYAGPVPPERDVMQLMAYVVLLEEHFCCTYNHAYMIYTGSKHKCRVLVTEELRSRLKDYLNKIQGSINDGIIPEMKRSEKCFGCQYHDYCWS